MSNLLLAAGGALAVLAGWVTYLATIPGGKVPARPVGALVLTLGGAGLGFAALVLGFRADALHAILIALSGFAICMGTGFPLLLTQRRTPVGKIQVKVGDTLLPFSAQASDGSPFHSDGFANQRILLKFFRGSW